MGKFIVSIKDNFAMRDGEGFVIEAEDKAADLAMPYITSIEWDEENGSGFYIKDDGTTQIATSAVVEGFISLWETAKHAYDLSQVVDLPTQKYIKRIEAKYFGRDRGKIGFTRTTTTNKSIKMQVRHNTDFYNISGLVTWVYTEERAGTTDSTIEFRDGNNVTHELNHDEVVELYNFARGYMNDILAATWTHKNAIDALTTAEQVDNYDVSTGWPSLT